MAAESSILLDRLDGLQRTRRGWRARCPAHEDRRPSLDLAVGAGGKLLVVCRAGCPTQGVLEALGVSWSALFPDRPPRRRAPSRFRSPLEAARAQVLAEARRQPWTREGILQAYAASDAIRIRLHMADRARHLACELGPTEPVWRALRLAALVEGEALLLEEVLDAR